MYVRSSNHTFDHQHFAMSMTLTRLSAAAVAAIGPSSSLGRLHPAVTTIRFQSSKEGAAKGKPTKFSSKVSNTAGKKKRGASSPSGQRDKALDVVIRALDAPQKREPPISEEELQRRHEIGRNHVIGRFEWHNAIQHDLTCKLAMKQHAIKMIPRDSALREEALRTDYTTEEVEPPLARHIPKENPPIPSARNSRNRMS